MSYKQFLEEVKESKINESFKKEFLKVAYEMWLLQKPAKKIGKQKLLELAGHPSDIVIHALASKKGIGQAAIKKLMNVENARFFLAMDRNDLTKEQVSELFEIAKKKAGIAVALSLNESVPRKIKMELEKIYPYMEESLRKEK